MPPRPSESERTRHNRGVPKIVDREQRRTEIIDAYLRVVARDGIETASSRAVAAEMGVSIGSLWHYFNDFDDVLFNGFRTVFDRTNLRITEQVEGSRGLAALVAMLAEILPLSKTTHDEALVVVSLWGRVPSRPELGRFQSEAEGLWRTTIRRQLEEAKGDRHLQDRAPVDDIADLLLVMCMGQQIEHVMQTEVARPDRQWRLAELQLAPWLTATGLSALREAARRQPLSRSASTASR